MTTEDYAARIAALADRMGSRAAVARALGMDQSGLWRRIRGESPVSTEAWRALRDLEQEVEVAG